MSHSELVPVPVMDPSRVWQILDHSPVVPLSIRQWKDPRNQHESSGQPRQNLLMDSTSLLPLVVCPAPPSLSQHPNVNRWSVVESPVTRYCYCYDLPLPVLTSPLLHHIESSTFRTVVSFL